MSEFKRAAFHFLQDDGETFGRQFFGLLKTESGESGEVWTGQAQIDIRDADSSFLSDRFSAAHVYISVRRWDNKRASAECGARTAEGDKLVLSLTSSEPFLAPGTEAVTGRLVVEQHNGGHYRVRAWTPPTNRMDVSWNFVRECQYSGTESVLYRGDGPSTRVRVTPVEYQQAVNLYLNKLTTKRLELGDVKIAIFEFAAEFDLMITGEIPGETEDAG